MVSLCKFKSVLIYTRIAKPFILPLQIFPSITNKITFSQNSNETRRICGGLAAPDFANSGKKHVHFPYVNSDSREKCIEYIFHDGFQNSGEKWIEEKASRIYVKNFQQVAFYTYDVAKLQRERSCFRPGLFREAGGPLTDLRPHRGSRLF